MKVKELIEALKKVDPEKEVTSMPDTTECPCGGKPSEENSRRAECSGLPAPKNTLFYLFPYVEDIKYCGCCEKYYFWSQNTKAWELILRKPESAPGKNNTPQKTIHTHSGCDSGDVIVAGVLGLVGGLLLGG